MIEEVARIANINLNWLFEIYSFREVTVHPEDPPSELGCSNGVIDLIFCFVASDKLQTCWFFFSKPGLGDNAFVSEKSYLTFRNRRDKTYLEPMCCSIEVPLDQFLEEYFARFRQFVEEDFHQVFLGNEWLDVPYDWGPYK